MSYEGFDFVPDGDKPAVVLNSEAVASRLYGTTDVSVVQIEKLSVIVDGEVIYDETVVEGIYRSALFVEGMMAYRGHSRRGIDSILVDAVFLLALRGYMGERVWVEATDPCRATHSFIRAILSGEETDVTIHVAWKPAV